MLVPGEVRELALRAPDPSANASPTAGEAERAWIPIDPIALDRSGTTSNLVAFEILDGGRFAPHPVGGGRWHVHGSRACNHLEVVPGTRTLIAFDARGQFGVTTFEASAMGERPRPRVPIAPGALLRIAFDGPEERARIALVARGIEYATRDLPRGAVWYELAPAGTVTIRVAAPGAEDRDIEVAPSAGSIVRVDV